MTNLVTQSIQERLMASVWLFESILWKYSNSVAYNSDKEVYKKILFEMWFKDIYEVVNPEVDMEKMNKFLNTVFTYYDNKNEWAKL